MIDAGTDVDIVMARGRWRSWSVFQKFYNFSQRLGIHFSLRSLLSASPSVSDRRRGIPYFNSSSCPVGPGGPISDCHHCFKCSAPDDDSLIWCVKCNKHLHACHFQVGQRRSVCSILQQWFAEGWSCEDCEELS